MKLFLSNLTFFLLIILVNANNTSKSANLSPAPYADWGNKHWVWLHHSNSNEENVRNMVNGYLERNITVGAVNIDSGWSTGYNNFIWDKTKFPNPEKLVQDMHDLGIKVILWMTSFVNVESSNYKEGYDNNYYLNDGAVIPWWHGKGSLLDYTNPKAVEWWNAQMKQVLDIGIDGWKLDGSDPYVYALFPKATGYAGEITHREYADLYYGNSFNFTREVRGDVSLTMARPVALLNPQPETYFLYLTYSPNNIVFSGWVGDQDGTFQGLKDAVKIMFHSCAGNATNFGSDIGGYRNDKSVQQGRTKQLFLRWAQLGALNPLMENGGGGDHTPWSWDEETVDIYRNFVNIHYEILPFMYNAATEAYNKRQSVMQPVTPVEDKTFDFSLTSPKYYDFTLWNNIHVSPITKDSEKTTVHFPENSNEWVDYWDFTLYNTNTLKNYEVPLNRFPIFLKRGSIIPMNVTTNDSHYGTEGSKGYLTIVIPYPQIGDSEEGAIREQVEGGMEFSYNYQKNTQGKQQLLFIASAYNTGIINLIEGIDSVGQVFLNNSGQQLQEYKTWDDFESNQEGYFMCNTYHRLWVKTLQQNQNGWFIQIDDLIPLKSQNFQKSIDYFIKQ